MTLESHQQEEKCNVWQPWQDDLLRTMKDKVETVSGFAKACEKTPTQVNNRWYKLQQLEKKEQKA